MVSIVMGKVLKDMFVLFFFGIGCNWFVNFVIW